MIADLSDFPNRAIQMAALDALDALRSPATVERVLRHLDDPDPVIQWKTVYVLERVTDPHGQNTGGDYSPTVSDFQQNPEHFTRIWKDWWSNTGRAQYAGVPLAH